jgi:hypothetical protein
MGCNYQRKEETRKDPKMANEQHESESSKKSCTRLPLFISLVSVMRLDTEVTTSHRKNIFENCDNDSMICRR